MAKIDEDDTLCCLEEEGVCARTWGGGLCLNTRAILDLNIDHPHPPTKFVYTFAPPPTPNPTWSHSQQYLSLERGLCAGAGALLTRVAFIVLDALGSGSGPWVRVRE